MISYISPILTIIGIFLSYRRFRTIYNPLLIFNFVWLIVSILVPLGLWNISTPSKTAYFIIIVGILGFNSYALVDWIVSEKPYCVRKEKEIEIENFTSAKLTTDFNNLVFFYIAIVVLSLTVASIQQIKLLFDGAELVTIRTAYFSNIANETLYHKVVTHVRMFILNPMLNVIYMVAMIDWLFGRKSKSLFCTAVSLLVLNTYLSAGRYGILLFVSSGILMLIFAKHRKTVSLRSAVAFVLILSFIMGIALQITDKRPTLSQNTTTGNSEVNTLKTTELTELNTEIVDIKPELTTTNNVIVEGVDTPTKPVTKQDTNISSSVSQVDSSEKLHKVKYEILEITEKSIFSKLSAKLSNLISSVVVYYTGGVTYMGVLLENNPEILMQTKGVNLLHSVIYPPLALLRMLRLIEWPHSMHALTDYTHSMIEIGDGVYFNALTTMFFPMYQDFGFFGVFWGSFIFSLVCLLLYRKAISKSSNAYKVAYAMILTQITHSSTSMFFYSTDFVLQFIYIWPLFINSIDRRLNVNKN